MTRTPAPDLESIRHALLREADRCVRCGLCLKECPTYRIERQEGASPRGRIALMQALLAGEADASPALARHLDTCATCGACDRACPSGVRYVHLIETTRAHFLPRTTRTLWARALARALATPALARRLVGWARHLPPLTPRWRRLRALATPAKTGIPAPGLYRASASARGRVLLFSGCATQATDAITVRAALNLLLRCGFDVEIPASLACCGALARQAGAPDIEARLAADNAAFVKRQRPTAIVYVTPLCGTHLAEQLAGSPPVHELLDFLDRHLPADTALRPLDLRIALHVPCSARRAGATSMRQLLRRIPQLEVVGLEEGGACCGGAGNYPLRHGALADALRAPAVESVIGSGVGALVTTSIGCALHLGAGLSARGAAVEVVHPAVLVDRQWPD